MAEHSTLTQNHRLENWSYANATARTTATGFAPGDIGKVAYQEDTFAYYRLTATTPVWVLIGGTGSGGGNRSGGYGLTTNFAGSNVSTEQAIAAVKIAGNTAGSNASDGVWGVRFRFFGTLKGGGELATFTPRIRWGTSVSDITGTLILATPTILAANNTTGAAFDMEMLVNFTGLNTFSSQFAEAFCRIIEHTSDAGGLLKMSYNNTKAAPVGIGNVTTAKWINISFQKSGTSTSAFYIATGTFEILGNTDPHV